ncbi:MAG: hypothetical protein Q8L68_07845, partial [Methylococcales bacterium]|nr:hypothetical protein [Methylococcales bacterium]
STIVFSYSMEFAILYSPALYSDSGNRTDQQTSFPASNPNPRRDGLAHGSASKSIANPAADGEKYAITSQCRLPDSCRVKTAISAGSPADVNTARNAARISSDGSSAVMPSPRGRECQKEVMRFEGF